ncbi:hypothetical protein HGRIS_010618 [Hohenbuehelia grisea]|uniref:Uncharacterized protein n=1 Tax=Hohenbuehelia grisea TaxID=104357 RepID=A0ABR3IXG2_9AGAR
MSVDTGTSSYPRSSVNTYPMTLSPLITSHQMRDETPSSNDTSTTPDVPQSSGDAGDLFRTPTLGSHSSTSTRLPPYYPASPSGSGDQSSTQNAVNVDRVEHTRNPLSPAPSYHTNRALKR